jgi:hypothetical protein
VRTGRGLYGGHCMAEGLGFVPDLERSPEWLRPSHRVHLEFFGRDDRQVPIISGEGRGVVPI